MNPCALVRTVNLRLALRHHYLRLVWTIYVLASHGKLPAHLYASCRAHNPVVAVTLIEFRTFCCMVFLSSIKYDAWFSYHFRSICRKFSYGQYGVESSPASSPSIYEIAFSVFIPERTGIYHAFSCQYTDRFLPSASWVLGLHHENTMVWVAPIDIELSIVVADGWSPNTLAMLRLAEEFLGFLFLQGIADDFPVYQILAMKDRQTGNAVE